MQKWKSLLSLCTEDVISYPSALFSNGSDNPSRGKVALLGQVSAFRRHYQRLRIEVYRPRGLAMRYESCFAERDVGWDYLKGAELFEFAGTRICQIGAHMNYQHWLILNNPTSASLGTGHSS